MHKAKSLFLLFVLGILFFSWMQLDFCPEKQIMVNGRPVHGLCAVKARTRTNCIWPIMGCKTMPTAYLQAENPSKVSVKSPGLLLVFGLILFLRLLNVDPGQNNYLPNRLPLQSTDPPLQANKLRGPPLSV